jgi:hypothetical protein
MGKNILRKHFQNMYGNNKPLQSNRNTENLLKNISVNNAEGEDVVNYVNKNSKIANMIMNAEKKSESYKRILPPVTTPSTFGFGGALLLGIFIIILFIIIRFREDIYNYYLKVKNQIFSTSQQQSSPYKTLEEKYSEIIKQMSSTTDNGNNLLKEKDEKLKEKELEIERLNKSISQKEEEHNQKQSEIAQSAVGQVKSKLSQMCNFKKNTRVTKDGYCYIGYDLGKRECTDVYAGDICMSGDIFPTMAQCENPKLR